MVNLRQFCDQLSKDLEMGDNPIKEESSGVFLLLLEGNVNINIGYLSEGFSLHSVLCNLPKVNPELFLIEVMDANLFGQATRNCVLGLTEDGNQLTLSRAIDYNMNYEGFMETLQDFYNMALFWRDQAQNSGKT